MIRFEPLNGNQYGLSAGGSIVCNSLGTAHKLMGEKEKPVADSTQQEG